MLQSSDDRPIERPDLKPATCCQKQVKPKSLLEVISDVLPLSSFSHTRGSRCALYAILLVIAAYLCVLHVVVDCAGRCAEQDGRVTVRRWTSSHAQEQEHHRRQSHFRLSLSKVLSHNTTQMRERRQLQQPIQVLRSPVPVSIAG